MLEENYGGVLVISGISLFIFIGLCFCEYKERIRRKNGPYYFVSCGGGSDDQRIFII